MPKTRFLITVITAASLSGCATEQPTRGWLNIGYERCLNGDTHACDLLTRLENQANEERLMEQYRTAHRDAMRTARFTAAQGAIANQTQGNTHCTFSRYYSSCW